MNLKKSFLQLIFILLFIISPLKLQSQEYNLPNDGELGCVQFFRENHTLTFPILSMSSNSRLELRFDVFGMDNIRYYYSVELRDYNWEVVDKDPFDYLEGYGEYYTDPYGHSVNALVRYNQYRLYLPNDDLRFLLPGNYMLKVYKDDNKKEVLMTKRFVVVDELVDLKLNIDDYQSAIYEDRQEIQAEVKPKDLTLNELSGNIKLMILQNNSWKTSKFYEKYLTNAKGNIMFNMHGQITFMGGNEFRFFDMKSFKFISERVQYMDYIAPAYHVFLKEDMLRGTKKHFSNKDLNGMFFISNQETHDPDTLDAEYAFVHFYLNTGVPLPEDIYVEGAFTGWDYDKNYMVFNPETGLYEIVFYLKQGLYNYRYVSKEYDTQKVMRDITEGNYYETNNSYMGVVYYRPLGELYYYPVAVDIMQTE